MDRVRADYGRAKGNVGTLPLATEPMMPGGGDVGHFPVGEVGEFPGGLHPRYILLSLLECDLPVPQV